MLPLLVLGFLLGMRHATDADHVVAVSTIVSRERSIRAAAPIGALWGVGHTLTMMLVGGAIIGFGLVIPPRVGLTMELVVAGMLLLLGGMNLRGALRRTDATQRVDVPGTTENGRMTRLRPVLVGVAHGLAGSAAVALLVLGSIRNTGWAVAYLGVFGAGTIAGMVLVTTAFALPIAATAGRFERLHRALGIVTGITSLILGAVLVYRIGFIAGLFSTHPTWRPE